MPAAFVVGAPAYAGFVDGTGLRARIEARTAEIDVDDPAALAGKGCSALSASRLAACRWPS